MGLKAAWREDLITSLLSILLVAGLFLDGWNHINLENGALGSFFTIWHALLCAGAAFRMTDFLTFAGVDPVTRHSQKPTFA